MTIIDCRFRPPTPEFKLVHGIIDNWGWVTLPEWKDTLTLDDVVKQMEELDMIGVVHARGETFPGAQGAKVPDNEHIKSLMDKHPGRWIGMGVIDFTNRRQSIKDIDQCAKWGFKGIHLELSMSGWSPDDRRLWPLYAHMEDLDLVCGFTAVPMNMAPHTNDPYLYEPMLKDFPDLRVLIAHAAHARVEDMMQMIWSYPNLWCTPDGYWLRPNFELVVKEANWPPEHYEYKDIWSASFSRTRDRWMYASAYPYSPPPNVFLEAFKNLGWSKEVLEKVLYSNAAELFKLDGGSGGSAVNPLGSLG